MYFRFISATLQFLTAVLVKIPVMWDVTPCPLVNSYCRFGVLCCLSLLRNRVTVEGLRCTLRIKKSLAAKQKDIPSHEVSLCFLHCSACRFMYHRQSVDRCVAEHSHCCDVLCHCVWPSVLLSHSLNLTQA